MRIQVERMQHPVGQGGMHSTKVALDGGTPFWAIYDCGAHPKAQLLGEIDRIAAAIESKRLDLLTLSHLDSDHVNGVSELLAQLDVDTVVLPYLEPWERLVLAAEACSRGELTNSYLEMIRFPARWLAERGAR